MKSITKLARLSQLRNINDFFGGRIMTNGDVSYGIMHKLLARIGFIDEGTVLGGLVKGRRQLSIGSSVMKHYSRFSVLSMQ